MTASSSRRYLSVWLRRLPTDRLIRCGSLASAETNIRGSRSAQQEAPLVVVEPVKGALRLAAVNDAAAQLGLKPGLALADARARYPRIAVADADPAADARLLEAIADWCDRYTPLVGLDPPDGLLLDITGCAHLFGGEEALRRDVVARLARQGFSARAAIADTVGCASAVARFVENLSPRADNFSARIDDDDVAGRATASPPPLWGRDGQGGGNKHQPCGYPPPQPSPTRGEGAGPSYGTVISSNRTQKVLFPLPLAALRIDADTTAALAQVGLTRIADVIDRPRAPLAARFGEHFVRRLDQAIGRADEPITPRLPVPSYVTERRFAEPIAREEDVLGTIAHLAHELSRLLERRGEGARLIEAVLFRTDGKVHRIAAGTGAPLRDPERVRALFVERLAAIGDECDPGFGYDVVRLAALSTERSDPVQTGLATPDHAAELSHLVDRLGARFGLRRVTRLVPQDTHIPEFAVTAVAAVNRTAALKRVIPDKSQDSLVPIRPIRLFERPERIEATAQVPDGPPIQFTWRHMHYIVAHAEGPERIEMEWWRNEQGRKLTRDYFRVESREGLRAWLYRDGFFNSRIPPSWFLHGVFA
jgi:protein ImuB